MLKLIFYVKTHGAAQVMVAAASVSPRIASDVSRVVCSPALAAPVSPRHHDIQPLSLLRPLGTYLSTCVIRVVVFRVKGSSIEGSVLTVSSPGGASGLGSDMWAAMTERSSGVNVSVIEIFIVRIKY